METSGFGKITVVRKLKLETKGFGKASSEKIIVVRKIKLEIIVSGAYTRKEVSGAPQNRIFQPK